MLSAADNELLTRTNAGTPMGELFRRFWLPVALSSELPEIIGICDRVLVMREGHIEGEVGGRYARRSQVLGVRDDEGGTPLAQRIGGFPGGCVQALFGVLADTFDLRGEKRGSRSDPKFGEGLFGLTEKGRVTRQ